ncbi:MAG: uroporphyrinogen decarboxylase family protein [Chloroflexota bacterium]
MNGRERYQRALKFAGPDRAPIMHRAVPGAVHDYGRVLLDLYDRYPSDVLHPKSAPGAWYSFRGAVGEGSGLVHGVVDEWGCVWDSLVDDYLGQVIGHPLSDWSKLEGYAFPDPLSGKQGVLDMVADAKADRHQHYVLIQVGYLWHRTNWLRGFENSLMDVLEDSPEMYFLRDKIVDVLLKRVEYLGQFKEYIDGVLVNDDWGMQQTLMIRPQYWRKVYKPAYAKVVAAIKDNGWNAHLHSDGVTHEIMDDLIEIGFDELNPQMSCMDIEDIGRRFGGKICFRADMDRQYTLPYGSPAEVETYVQRMFDAFGHHNGGYVGYGQVGTDVPIANVEAMLAKMASFKY